MGMPAQVSSSLNCGSKLGCPSPKALVLFQNAKQNLLYNVNLENKIMETIEDVTWVTRLATLSSSVTNLLKNTVASKNHREGSRSDSSRNYHEAMQRKFETNIVSVQKRV
ncbi:hypothetical protein TNCV_1662511 [Trichonephila clavipes]|nr:hypothetical protein TNCV_1662511 [Trichonephila clavipes]